MVGLVDQSQCAYEIQALSWKREKRDSQHNTETVESVLTYTRKNKCPFLVRSRYIQREMFNVRN
jgi:hypothetical protein